MKKEREKTEKKRLLKKLLFVTGLQSQLDWKNIRLGVQFIAAIIRETFLGPNKNKIIYCIL